MVGRTNSYSTKVRMLSRSTVPVAKTVPSSARISSSPALVESTGIIIVAVAEDGFAPGRRFADVGAVSEKEKPASASFVDSPPLVFSDSSPIPTLLVPAGVSAPSYWLELAAAKPRAVVADATTSPTAARTPMRRLRLADNELMAGLGLGGAAP